MSAARRVAEFDEANPGKSTRDAGAELGISKSEVNRARNTSGVPFGTPEKPASKKVKGADGKSYPAQRPRHSIPKYTPGVADEIDQLSRMGQLRQMRT